MAPATTGSRGAMAAGYVLSALIALFYIWLLPGLASLSGSDAAGNALSQAYAAIITIVLWGLLALLAFIAWIKGDMPWPAALAALILIPVSGIVALMAGDLLASPRMSPYLWPIIIPAAIPPLIVAFSLWALVPALRGAVAAPVAAGTTLGATLILCAAIVPLEEMRRIVIERDIAARQKYDADFARLPVDSPLWDYAPFLDTPDDTKKAAVLDRIRKLDHRQSDAELMLDRGDFPLGYIGRIDLDPSPALCEKARALLRRRVERLVLKTPESEPYSKIFWDLSDALAAMKWLVGYNCACDAESLAWENMAKGYRGTNFDVIELARLRDPKELGRVLREHPERFSMLSPKSHLKAWLRFADDKTYREQAIAGARKLDHRTTDAIEMLTDKYDPAAPWTVLKYLPVLDLEASEPLCKAALAQVRGDLMKVYRPRADDPRPYRELLDRLGVYEPLTALQWLAGHGCNAEAELSEAEVVVRTYQDSPDRAAMLAKLAQLHRKP
jgi:hypothetical protein